MSIAIQVTAEGGCYGTAVTNLQAIAKLIEDGLIPDRCDGTGMEVKIGDKVLGIVSVENDMQMGGRMRLRRVGQPHPAFEG